MDNLDIRKMVSWAEMNALEEELNDLARWKAQAMTVLDELDLQFLGRLLDVPLGHSIAKAINKKLPEILTERNSLTSVVKTLSKALKS